MNKNKLLGITLTLLLFNGSFAQNGLSLKGVELKTSASDIVSVKGTNSNVSVSASANISLSGTCQTEGSIVIDNSTINIASGADVTINNHLTTQNSATINNNGALNLKGDFTCNGQPDLGDGDGTYGVFNFTGTSQQTIQGSATPLFEQFTIDNANGISLSTDMQVSQDLTFSTGVVTTNASRVHIVSTSESVISNYSDTKYILGNLRQNVAAGNTYPLPIGTGAQLELALVEIVSASGLNFIDASFTVDGSQMVPGGLTVNSTSIDQFLDYGYWTITPDGGTYSINLEVQSKGHTDLGGTADQYSLISDTGSGWEDYGLHSYTTQNYNASTITAKRSQITTAGNFIVGFSSSPLYDQPALTNELVVNGGLFKITAASNVNQLGSNADVNLQNSGTFKIDGTLNLEGNWTNNATDTLDYGDNTSLGKVVFSGSGEQTINGTALTAFEQLEINNTSGMLLNVSTQVVEELILTDGLISTGINNIYINNTSSSAISSYSENSYVNGNLRQKVATSNTYNLPVGTSSEYELATLEMLSNTGITYIQAKFTEDATQTPPAFLTVNGARVSEFLDYGYWTLSPDAGYGEYDLTVRSGGHSNGGETPDRYALFSRISSNWSDYGTHSPSTQSFDNGYIIAKRSSMTSFGNYIVGKTSEDAYSQPTITNEFINNGTFIKLTGTDTLSIEGNAADFKNQLAATAEISNNSALLAEADILNDGTATIASDGAISLGGNWENNATASLVLGDNTHKGSVTFSGTEEQSVDGTSITVFESVTINNSNNIRLYSGISASEQLTLNTGKVITGTNKLELLSGAGITGASVNSYISGNLRYNVSTGTYNLPVGSINNYEPAAIEITDATGLTYIDASFTEDHTQSPPFGLTLNGAAIDEFLNYGYWTVTPDNAGSSTYNITLTSIGHTNGGGTPEQYGVITDRGSGWEDYGVHSTSTQVVNNDTITAKRSALSDFGSYIIGKAAEDTYVQPIVTNELRNEGVYLKVGASGRIDVVGDVAAFNNDSTAITQINASGAMNIGGDITNSTNSQIRLDGTLSLEGDWNNYAKDSLVLGDDTNMGTVVFNSSEQQSITGDAVTIFDNFKINNTEGVLMNEDIIVRNQINFSNGKLNTLTNKAIIEKNATPVNYRKTTHLIGNLRQYVSVGSFHLPLGTSDYLEYAVIEFTNATGISYIDATFVEDHTLSAPTGLTVNGAAITEFLDMGYWSITPDAVGSSVYNVTIQSAGHTNGGATADKYAVITDAGSGWENLGTHSASTQVVTADTVSAKRSDLSQYGNFVIGRSEDDTYEQPLITNELRNEGVYLKTGNGQLSVLGTDAAFNNDSTATTKINENGQVVIEGSVTNNENSAIQINGSIHLIGDWTNNATAATSLGDNTVFGTVTFNGTSQQTIAGTTSTVFENFELNNTEGLLMNQDFEITNNLAFSSGTINTLTNTVIAQEPATFSGYDENKYISGKIRQYVSVGSFDLPLGNVNNYEFANIEFTNATGITYVDAQFIKDHTQNPPTGLTVSGAAITEFLNQGYWQITPDNAGSSVYNVTIQSIGHTNGGASADQYAVITDRGSGWENYGTHSASTQVVDGDKVLAKRSGLTDYGSFIIGKSEDDTYQQPLITNELRNEGVHLNLGANSSLTIFGTEAAFNNDSTANTTIENTSRLLTGSLSNNTNSAIELDGTIEITGNWENNAIASTSLGDGTNYGSVVFNGTAQQYLTGSSTTVFENFEIDNVESIFLETDFQVNQTLTLTNGIIKTLAKNAILTSGADFSGQSENSYVSGNIRRYVGTGTFELPLGTDENYELASIEITDATGLTYIDAAFVEDHTQIPPGGLTVDGTAVTEFLNYGYWSITPDNAGSSQYNLTLHSIGHSNGGGVPEQYSVITDSGSGWEDYGSHSSSTQQINGDEIVAKRSVLNDYGHYMIGKSYEENYNQPLITNELRNEGVYFKLADSEKVSILGTDALLVNDSTANLFVDNSAELLIEGEVQNSTNSTIEINGQLALHGNWTNNAIASLSDGDGTTYGTVVFEGTEKQSILGSTSTVFENLTINNASNVELVTNQEVAQTLDFTSGLIETLTNFLTISNTSTTAISNYDETKYVYGNLRRYLTTDVYDFPVGTESYYELSTIEVNSHTGLTYMDVSFTKDNTQTPPPGLTVSGAIMNEFLNYGYWTVGANGGLSAIDYDVTCISTGHTNGAVSVDSLALVADVGSGWQDYGTHSNATQNINGQCITAKRSNVDALGSFIIASSNSPTYAQPAMTDELRVKAGILKVVGTGQVVVSGPYAELNSDNSGAFKIASAASIDVEGDVNLTNNGSIEIDGTLYIDKDWSNEGTASLSLGDATSYGTVVFNGSLEQTITGSVVTLFEHLQINNSNNIVLNSIDANITQSLTFTNGLMITGLQKLIVSNAATSAIAGYGTNKYIYGNLRRYVTTDTYDLPIGTADNYELANIQLASATDLSYIDVSYALSDENPVPGGLTVNGTTIDEFLDYGYWTISGEPGFSNLNYTLTISQRGHSDLGGPSERYAVVSKIPAGGSWDDNGNHSPSTQTYNTNLVSAKRTGLTDFGSYIIGKGITDLFLQPTITDELRIKGVSMVVSGSLPAQVMGANAILTTASNAKLLVNNSSTATIYGEVLNTESSSIQLDGTLSLKGDWTNNAASSLVLAGGSAGTVEFSGTSVQTIAGSAITNFENLVINNTDSVLLQGFDHTVSSTLTLSSGLLVTESQKISVTNTNNTAITGYSTASYIKGTLRRYVVLNNYELPVGTTDYYELCEIQLNAATNLNYIDVTFTKNDENPVPGGLTVNGQPITNFTDYGYWTITGETGYSNVNYNLSLTSRGHTDLGITSERYAIISKIPSGSSWDDNGNHSPSTQEYTATTVKAERTALSDFGHYIIGKGVTSLYNQPTITEELYIKGASLAVKGTEPLQVQGPNAALNNNTGELLVQASSEVIVAGQMNNLASSKLSVDGTIRLTGHFVNNGTADLSLGDLTNRGLVLFEGTQEQQIEGTTTSIFENLTLNNSNNLKVSGTDAEVSNLLTFTAGKITTNGQRMVVSNTNPAAIVNYNNNRYINGNLRRYVTTDTYELPVGTTDFYELAQLTINTATDLGYIDVSFVETDENPVPGGLTVNGQPIIDFTDYGYWSIEGEPGYSNLNFTAILTIRGHTDLGQTSERYAIISKIPNTGSWADNGIHSTSTQTYNTQFVTAKRSNFSGFGNFIIAKGSATLFNQPDITDEFYNKEAIVKVNGAEPLSVQGANAKYNNLASGTTNIEASSTLEVNGDFTNYASSNLGVDGTLILTGNWINNSGADISLGDGTNIGTLMFEGTAQQTVEGGTVTQFENLTLNNANGLVLNGVDAEISSQLTFTDGKFNTNGQLLTVSNNQTTAIAGFNNTRYIIGELRRYVSQNTYEIPVGTASYFEKVNLEINSATDLNYIDIEFIESDENPVPGGVTVNNNPINSFLDYGYWSLTGESGYSNLNYNITIFSRGHTDLGGDATQYAVLSKIPSIDAWDDNGVHSTTTQTYSPTTVSARRSQLTGFGHFIVGKGASNLYNQPLITDELRNKGASITLISGLPLKISGPAAEFNNASNGSLNVKESSQLVAEGDINNLESAVIGIDGEITLTGNWTNNATASTILGDDTHKGSVLFNGLTTQTISGSSATVFETVELNNAGNLELSNSDAEVTNQLLLTNGKVITSAQKLIISNTATNAIADDSKSKYILGTIRRYVTNESYKIPVGTSDYLELVKVDITSSTGLDYLDVSFVESTEGAPANLQVNGNYVVEFLDYGYWDITANAGVTAADYNITVHNFGATNASSVAQNHTLVSDLGNGWDDNGTHNNLTQEIISDTVIAARTNVTTANSNYFGKFIVGVFGDPFNIPVTEEFRNIASTININNNAILHISGSTPELINRDVGTINLNTGGNLIVYGQITNQSAATLNIMGDLDMYGNLINDANTNITSGEITFMGTLAQEIGGTSSTTFDVLTINKGANDVTLANNIRVNNALNLTSKDIILSNYNLTLASGVTINYPDNNTSYIQVSGTGKVVQEFSGTPSANITLPIGDNTDNYTPVDFRLNSGTLGASPTVSFGVTNSAHPNLELSNNYIKRYWSYTPTDISNASYNITIHYLESDVVGDETVLVFSKFSGGNWLYNTAFADDAANTISWLNATSFSDGTGGEDPNPLPIELIAFNGNYNAMRNQVELSWTTASEINNGYFTIEQSENGIDFTPIAVVKGAGNSYQPINYSSVDRFPVIPVTYYRLKQTDYDGTSATSDIIAVNVTYGAERIKIYPNPAKAGHPINLSLMQLPRETTIEVSLHSNRGQMIEKYEMPTGEQGKVEVEMLLNESLPPAVYIIYIQTTNETFSKYLIIK